MRNRLRGLVTAISSRVPMVAPARWRLVLLLLLALSTAGLALTDAHSQASPQSLAAQLQARDQGEIAYHRSTGLVRFYSAGAEASERALQAAQAGKAAPADPQTTARSFLDTYGPLFGVNSPAKELTTLRVTEAGPGRSFMRYQQLYQDVPVMAGELIVQVAGATVLSANGEIAPIQSLSSEPTLSPLEASERVLALITKGTGLAADQLQSTEPELWVYDPRLLTPHDMPSSLVWRMEVYSEVPLLHQMVLIDAHLGAVVLQLDLLETALNRAIYDSYDFPLDALPGLALVRSEGQAPTGLIDSDLAYDYLGDAYHFYLNRHGRDSFDDAGATLIATVRFCWSTGACPYPNAFWTEYYQQFAFGDGMLADDVVAHEYTHAVTEHTSGLFYMYQSGAINEGLSDIWGEFVDLSNARGNDSHSARWLLGEDLPPTVGVIRNMADPTAYGQPDRMTSPYYYCDPQFLDNGGVHDNSGVLNNATFLITDGGAFNGQAVSGLGMEKAAHIFYELQAHLLTTGSEYNDVYNLLPRACYDLIGTSDITPLDCQQVINAVVATEMDKEPTACAIAEAQTCPPGEVDTDLFYDGFETDQGSTWGVSLLSGDEGSFHHWYLNEAYAAVGASSLWNPAQDLRADTTAYMASDVFVPVGKSVFLRFLHSYSFERVLALGYLWFTDGGVLEYSVDSGMTWQDASPLFTDNGYQYYIDPIYPDLTYNDNPLQGRDAFVGSSHGWTPTRLDLSPLAGQSVRFRFRVGTDTGTGYPYYDGWFIDDIRIYTCDDPTPTPTAIPSPTVTPTASATPRPTATPTVAPTATPTPGPNYLPFVRR